MSRILPIWQKEINLLKRKIKKLKIDLEENKQATEQYKQIAYEARRRELIYKKINKIDKIDWSKYES